MSHSRFLSLAVAGLVLAASAAALAQPPAARRGDAGPLPSIEEKTAGMKKLDGLFPLYWDERSGPAVDGDRAAQHRVPPQHRLRRRPRLERHRPRSRRPRRLAHRHLRARGAEGADGGAQLPVPLGDEPGAGVRARRAGRLRAQRAVGLHGRRRVRRARARGRDRVPRARRRQRRPAAAARRVPPRCVAQHGLPADDAELPEEHRDGGRADVRAAARRGGAGGRRRRSRRAAVGRRGRGVLRGRPLGGGLARRRDHPRAPVAGRAARRELQAARVGPARRATAT